MKRIALIFLALQLISSVVYVYSCKLAFASAIDRPGKFPVSPFWLNSDDAERMMRKQGFAPVRVF